MEDLQYKCSKCGLGVIVKGVEKPIFACECAAPIIGEMSAEAFGDGGVTN